MKTNIRLSLDRLKPSDLLTLFRNVEAKLTEHVADFPSPPVTLAEMATLAQQLEDAIEEAIDGSRQSKLVRDAIMEDARGVLRRQADYVRMVSAGNAVLLARSGFPLEKQRTPVGIPGSPAAVEARMTGLQGEVELRWKSVHGARGYQVWMSMEDPALGRWQAIGYTTRVKHLVSDLESYRAYFFCVSAIGAAGEGAQSDPALGRAA